MKTLHERLSIALSHYCANMAISTPRPNERLNLAPKGDWSAWALVGGGGLAPQLVRAKSSLLAHRS
jgi:hypothetical protein